jgi:uncharacterized protein YbjT (DUF2867 family)
MQDSKLVLVTGATGYIGGRLVPHLLEAGYRVRFLVRDAKRAESLSSPEAATDRPVQAAQVGTR